MAMKGEPKQREDPMFTTKAVTNCASCTKGVSNLAGYRADHVSWDAFPFKDPGARILKSGMNRSRIKMNSTTNEFA
jgi:hypothetical protein